MQENNFEIYTTEQIADALSLPINTIKRYFREGKLKGFKVGAYWRMLKTDFESYISENKNDRITTVHNPTT
jgi:excisionase family DNA binding protein